MNLTPQEITYLGRFCYEVVHFVQGEGCVFQECPGRYQDLGDLTNFAPADIEAQWERRDRQLPPRTPFPWQSGGHRESACRAGFDSRLIGNTIAPDEFIITFAKPPGLRESFAIIL